MIRNNSTMMEYLKEKDVQMSHIGADYISEDIVKQYVNQYGSWKLGDKVKIKISESELESRLQEDEIEDHKVLFGKEWTITQFYNVGAMHLEGFDYGVEMNWFEKVNN